MTIKLLQLNMWAGTHFDKIKEFLEKNNFDILCFQEVAGKGTHCGNVDCSFDCYDELKKFLGEGYESQQLKTDVFTSNPQTSYQGIAIFYRKTFHLVKSTPVILYQHEGLYLSDAKSFEDMTRGFLHVDLTYGEKHLQLLTAHLSWGTTKFEQPHQRAQNLQLIAYMKKVQSPWILTGDFNIVSDQPSIMDLDKIGRDLTNEYKVKNTFDPLYHIRWVKMKPGFAIDYIYVSKDIQVDDFQALEHVHMSDHLGLTAIVEI